MSNLNDFLGPVYKTKNVTVTKTLSSNATTTDQTEITDLQTTVPNVNNDSVIIDLNLTNYYSNGSGFSWLLCFRNTVPTISYVTNNLTWDKTNQIFCVGTRHTSTGYSQIIEDTFVDNNAGNNPIYKFVLLKDSANGSYITSGGTVKFTTNPLYDLTA